MGVKPVSFDFNGKLTQHLQPGAYSDSKFIDSNGGVASVNNGVILGDAVGGEPNQIYTFYSVGDAEQVLKRGSLLDAVRFAFNPGGGYKPQRVKAMAINQKTRAAVALTDNEGNEIFKVLARDFGVDGNALKINVRSYTEEDGVKRVTVQKNDSVLLQSEFGKEIMTVQLASSAAQESGTIDVKEDALVVTVGDQSKTLEFSQYSIIGDIVEGLKAFGVEVTLLSPDFQLEDSSILEAESGLQMAKDSPLVLKSVTQDLIEILDQSGIVIVEKLDGFKNAVKCGDSDNILALSGGQNGPCTAVDFANALELLEQEDIQFITTPSTDLAVALLLADHCERMSSRTGKGERQFLIGHEWGADIDSVVQLAMSVGSRYGALLSPGFVDYDPSDVDRKRTMNFHSGYYAAKEMGRLMAMSVPEPPTYKAISCLSLEKNYKEGEKDRLIQAGVWCAELSKKGIIRNVRSVTMNKGSNLMECEFSVMRETLWMQRDLREAIDDSVVGHAGDEGITATIMSVVLSKLSYYKNSAKTIRHYEEDSIVITIDGDRYDVQWLGCPTLPVNFVMMKNNFMVYRSSGTMQ